MVKLKIGARLKELREAKGVSQTEAGKVIGVSKKTMSCYENDVNDPPLSILLKISEYYQVNVDYILTGKISDYNKINITDERLLNCFKELDSFDLNLKKSLEIVLNGFILGYKKS
jgi:transcriptional regulator with XRE-family HTH domain